MKTSISKSKRPYQGHLIEVSTYTLIKLVFAQKRTPLNSIFVWGDDVSLKALWWCRLLKLVKNAILFSKNTVLKRKSTYKRAYNQKEHDQKVHTKKVDTQNTYIQQDTYISKVRNQKAYNKKAKL